MTVHTRYRPGGRRGAAVQYAALATLARLARPVHYRGVQRLTWTLGRVFDPDNHVTVVWNADRRLRIHLDDGYWAPLLDPRYRFEPELDDLLRRVLSRRAYLVDCGANIGYWSVRVRPRVRAVVAVEPYPETFARLQANARANGPGITCVQAAVWRTDGETLSVVGHHLRHAGASVVNRRERAGTGGYVAADVPSVTVDRLVAEHCPDPSAPIVLKLDVEGAEVAALEGARTTLAERDVLVVYEDHGQDAAAEASAFAESIGLRLFLPRAEGPARPVRLADVRAMKTDRRRGYNLVACSSGSPFLPVLGCRG
jgi:FkbM family methyltransferase